MPTMKPVSPSLGPDRIGSAPIVDEGMQIVKTQLASATVLPRMAWQTQFALTSEILAFMGRRMQAHAEFCARLCHCQEIGEAVDAQQEFAKGVGGAYADEAEKLSTLARKNMDAWTGAGAEYMSNWTGNHEAAA